MFKCNLCTKDYKWIDSLHKHMKIHRQQQQQKKEEYLKVELKNEIKDKTEENNNLIRLPTSSSSTQSISNYLNLFVQSIKKDSIK